MSVFGENTGGGAVAGGSRALGIPLLYRDGQGAMGNMTAGYIDAVMGVGWSGKIVAIGTNGDSWYFNGLTWVQTDSDITGGADAPSGMYLDSSGNIYAGFDDDKLYRTPDFGVTWTAVQTFVSTPSYPSLMCEDSNGWLYVGSYNTGAGGAGEVFRSKDSGVTWTDITANLAHTNSGLTFRHVHGCHWDHHHNALLIASGDGGATDPVQVSFDFGETFFDWTITSQVTAVTFDDDYIYLQQDQATGRSIWRVNVAGLAHTSSAWNAAILETMLNPFNEPDITDATGAGFAWWGYVDDQGTVYFPYGNGTENNILWASSDQGVTWFRAHEDTTSLATFAFKFAVISSYQTDWDGCFINESSGGRGPYRWRIVRSETELEVNEAGGGITEDGINGALSALPEVDGMSYELTANYTANASTGMDGAVINSNGFTLGTAETGTLIINEDFEGASSLTNGQSTGVVVTQTSTVQAHSPTRSAELDLTGGSSGGGTYGEVKKISGIIGVSGETVWASCWNYCDSASWAANTANRIPCHFRNAVNKYIAWISLEASSRIFANYDDGSGHSILQTTDTYVTLPLQSWFHIKAALYVHATEGRIRYWINNRLLFDIVGINTFPSSSNITQSGFQYQSSNMYKWYVDDCKISKGFDPEKPEAIVMNGRGSVVRPDGIY